MQDACIACKPQIDLSYLDTKGVRQPPLIVFKGENDGTLLDTFTCMSCSGDEKERERERATRRSHMDAGRQGEGEIGKGAKILNSSTYVVHHRALSLPWLPITA